MSDQSIPAKNHPESSFIDVEAWTEETLENLRKLRVTSSPETIRQGVSLSIPLDSAVTGAAAAQDGNAEKVHPQYEVDGVIRTREPRRRDSLTRREAVLKGKEGTRRRQKWENGTANLMVYM
jgi:hypothetical protein